MDLKPQNLLLSARENPVLKLAGMNFNTDQPFSIKAYAFLGSDLLFVRYMIRINLISFFALLYQQSHCHKLICTGSPNNNIIPVL